MMLVRPDYFDRFACIKGACRHSCCIGWEIDVDDASLVRYRETGGAIGNRLRRNIQIGDEGACFRMTEDERCPFLNGEGLCDLIIELGEESLCQICADHPRFRSFFSEREETGLGLCCEAAGRLILTNPEKVRLLESGEAALAEDEDELLALRQELTEIMQDRTQPVERRVERMLEAAGFAFDPDLPEWAIFLLELERLEDCWTERLQALASAEIIPELPPSQESEIAFEQLMVYLLYRHLPAALEDDDPEGHILYCVLAWRVIHAMVSLEGFGTDSMVEICREYSAELEYSDENIEAILDRLYEQ